MKDILEVIRQLSISDEKTLSQKTLKLFEEGGELAKVVLPHENAFATTHRFVTTTKILEEAVDTLLCSLSIVYELGFTDEDIREMMVQKALKWEGLQQASRKGRFPLPFELHVTVRLRGDQEEAPQLDNFKQVCSALGVKPIILDLNSKSKDVMTSSVIMTDTVGAYNEVTRIKQCRVFGCS